MKREKWTGLALAALLFFGGAAVGVLANRYYTATEVSAKTSETYRQHYVAEMESKLKLTPSQVKRLEAIMDDTKAKYKAVRDSYKPAILQVKNEHIALVKSMLTAQQIPGYEQLLSDRERRAREQDERDRREEQRRAAARQARAAK
jgi:hypothetical protein